MADDGHPARRGGECKDVGKETNSEKEGNGVNLLAGVYVASVCT